MVEFLVVRWYKQAYLDSDFRYYASNTTPFLAFFKSWIEVESHQKLLKSLLRQSSGQISDFINVLNYMNRFTDV